MLHNPDLGWKGRVLAPFWLLVYWLFLFVFVFLAAMVNLSCVLTAFLPRGSWRYGFYQGMIRTMTRASFCFLNLVGILKVRHQGFESIKPDADGKKPILVANHPNLLDVFLFYARLPKLTCIYKAHLKKTLIMNSMGDQLGYISNENPRRMIKEGAQRVRAGEQLLIFPEGTRTKTPPLNELRLGAAGIARRSGASLQTVVIHCGSNFLSKGRSVFAPPILPIYILVEVGPKFDPVDFPDARSLNQAMADYFRSELKKERYFEAS